MASTIHTDDSNQFGLTASTISSNTINNNIHNNDSISSTIRSVPFGRYRQLECDLQEKEAQLLTMKELLSKFTAPTGTTTIASSTSDSVVTSSEGEGERHVITAKELQEKFVVLTRQVQLMEERKFKRALNLMNDESAKSQQTMEQQEQLVQNQQLLIDELQAQLHVQESHIECLQEELEAKDQQLDDLEKTRQQREVRSSTLLDTLQSHAEKLLQAHENSNRQTQQQQQQQQQQKQHIHQDLNENVPTNDNKHNNNNYHSSPLAGTDIHAECKAQIRILSEEKSRLQEQNAVLNLKFETKLNQLIVVMAENEQLKRTVTRLQHLEQEENVDEEQQSKLDNSASTRSSDPSSRHHNNGNNETHVNTDNHISNSISDDMPGLADLEDESRRMKDASDSTNQTTQTTTISPPQIQQLQAEQQQALQDARAQNHLLREQAVVATMEYEAQIAQLRSQNSKLRDELVHSSSAVAATATGAGATGGGALTAMGGGGSSSMRSQTRSLDYYSQDQSAATAATSNTTMPARNITNSTIASTTTTAAATASDLASHPANSNNLNMIIHNNNNSMSVQELQRQLSVAHQQIKTLRTDNQHLREDIMELAAEQQNSANNANIAPPPGSGYNMPYSTNFAATNCAASAGNSNSNNSTTDGSENDNDNDNETHVTQTTQTTNASGHLLVKFQGQMLAMAQQNEELEDQLELTYQQLQYALQQLHSYASMQGFPPPPLAQQQQQQQQQEEATTAEAAAQEANQNSNIAAQRMQHQASEFQRLESQLKKQVEANQLLRENIEELLQANGELQVKLQSSLGKGVSPSNSQSLVQDTITVSSPTEVKLQTAEELIAGIKRQEEEENDELNVQNQKLKKQLLNKDQKLLEQFDELKEMANALNQDRTTLPAEINSPSLQKQAAVTSKSRGKMADTASESFGVETDQLKSRIGDLNAALQQAQQSLQQEEEKAKTEQARNDQMAAEIVRLEEQLRDKSLELEAFANAKSEVKEADILRLTIQLEEKKNEFDQAIQRHIESSELLREEVRDLQNQIDLQSADHEAATKRHQEEVSSLRQQFMADSSTRIDLLTPTLLENLPFLAKSSGQDNLPYLIEALTGDDVESISNSLKELAVMLKTEREDQGIRVSLCRSYGHLMVVNAMKRYPYSAEIQEGCLRVISMMCLVNKRLSLSAVGGIGNICIGFAAVGTLQNALAAMIAFPDNEGLQRRAVRAVNNMMSSKDLVPLFFDLEIFPVLVGSMRTFSEDSMIQEDGCRILRFVGGYPAAKELFKKEGIFRMLASIIERYDETSNTYKQACRAWNVVVGWQGEI